MARAFNISFRFKRHEIKKFVKHSKDKIAVRVPNHDCTLELLRNCGCLVGTSANLSGQSPFTDPVEGLKNIQNYDIFVDGGQIISKGESTIIEVKNDKVKIIRKGALKESEILNQ